MNLTLSQKICFVIMVTIIIVIYILISILRHSNTAVRSIRWFIAE